MNNVLVIQNARSEGLGLFRQLLESDGYVIETIQAKQEKIPSKRYSLLIILGAPESVNDDLGYLSNEMDLIQNYVRSSIPVLGICLGSQLIAKAFGASVYHGTKKEIGFFDDLRLEDKSISDLFTGFKSPFTAFHWHEETFTLPQNAVRLVHSSDYPNQAFKIGTAVGLQFHLEADESMINSWLVSTHSISQNEKEKILNDIEKNFSVLKQNISIFYKNFKNEFSI
ncbi:GMP synthase glutamine-hydrolyzing subunit A protein [Marine Group I thaumarchaeote SCGC AAA799-O18]|nr:GMP synthase glutamine-hydrolyzing subunit A protein [Marine Group I thaumarchaeote SCGC AAA799-O18]